MIWWVHEISHFLPTNDIIIFTTFFPTLRLRKFCWVSKTVMLQGNVSTNIWKDNYLRRKYNNFVFHCGTDCLAIRWTMYLCLSKVATPFLLLNERGWVIFSQWSVGGSDVCHYLYHILCESLSFLLFSRYRSPDCNEKHDDSLTCIHSTGSRTKAHKNLIWITVVK